jgi:hypothetical protein
LFFLAQPLAATKWFASQSCIDVRIDVSGVVGGRHERVHP